MSDTADRAQIAALAAERSRDMSERETLAVEAGWRVKPLEWEGDRHEREATCSFGTYQIVGSPDCERAILVAGEWIVWRGELRESADEARQDAQADFDARIRACIEPAPDPVKEAAWDGRPMSSDAFILRLLYAYASDRADAYDIMSGIEAWLSGDWSAALAVLTPEAPDGQA